MAIFFNSLDCDICLAEDVHDLTPEEAEAVFYGDCYLY